MFLYKNPVAGTPVFVEMWKPGRDDRQPPPLRQGKGHGDDGDSPLNGLLRTPRRQHFESGILQRERERGSTCNGRITFKHDYLARPHRRIYGQPARGGRGPNQAPGPKDIDACSAFVRRNDTQVPGKARRAVPKAELQQLDGTAPDGCGKPRISLDTPVGRELRPQSA